ncbi:hypothetical protein I6N90_11475 [Paenibacillus sp. GSMTC-2017]|uniref:hypothetical protein n=1 Tax=Paenibacillus sp. GSMTC-2017 TaxID=2794350 RepID=UPI0018D9199D|nr:hypothetical protein [Paenibacillus sp. GSMTC-2017]MBH5318429.1 hypothetical protein [Paenibacillus sp. GSMTC-2017]
MELNQKKDITAIFREALETFVEKIQMDDQVIAAILIGSLSYDQVWEKSDIDLRLIVHDQKLNRGYACFVENDIPINASIQTRNDFKRSVEGSVQSSISHSMLVRSTLLFTKDVTISEYLEQIRHVGERDRQLQLIELGSYALSLQAKAEKWLYVKDDPIYSAVWVIKMIDVLAQIEVVLHGDIPMREVVQQAIRYNSDVFQVIYTDFVSEAINRHKVEEMLTLIHQYLIERAESLFRPIIQYLKDEGDMRTLNELVQKFNLLIQVNSATMTTVCDWLAERGLIAKLEADTKVTPKSRVMLFEPAYVYEDEISGMWGKA